MNQSNITIVPNIDQLVRESTDLGPIGALLNRILHLNIFQMMILMWYQLPYSLNIISRDFAAGLILLIDAELLRLHRPQNIVLNAKMTDLALALGNQKLFSQFITHVQKHYRTQVGFATNNLGMLIIKLGQWRLRPDIIKINSHKLSSSEKLQLSFLPPNITLINH